MLISSALVALGATLAAAVPPLQVKNNQFVNSKTGNAFQIVGVAYQPGGSAGYNPALRFDPLSNATRCLRDAALMQVLGVNTIRVYNLDPDLNHDACASIFNAAGMYMMIDVNSPLIGESLPSTEPWTAYNKAYLNRTFAIVEAFKNYPNTAAFFAGNEVINVIADAKVSPPYIRAVTRDLKNYIAQHADRKIAVGYSAADVRSVLYDSWHYLECAENGDENDPSRADLFALNSYSWCGDSTFIESGYNGLVGNFTGNSIPVYFSEFGCNVPAPRIFTEIPVIYSDQMTSVFSGGIVYEYAQEVSNYGLVDIAKDGSATILKDFYTLRDQYAKVDFKKVQSVKASNQTVKPPKCGAGIISDDGFNSNFTLPQMPNDGSADLLKKGISPVPKGKIIEIKDWKVTLTVKNPDGSVISDLEVKPLADDGSNVPGTNNPKGANSTSSSPNPKSTNKDNAAFGKKSLGDAAMLMVWSLGALCVGLLAL